MVQDTLPQPERYFKNLCFDVFCFHKMSLHTCICGTVAMTMAENTKNEIPWAMTLKSSSGQSYAINMAI